MGSYVIAFEEEAGSVKDVEITEVDIDNFIRAKGAIFSAIRTMLNSLDFDVSMIDDVYVAGGIGSGINMANAVHIGMFPDIPLEKLFSYRCLSDASFHTGREKDIRTCIQYDLSGAFYSSDLYGRVCRCMLYSAYGYTSVSVCYGRTAEEIIQTKMAEVKHGF